MIKYIIGGFVLLLATLSVAIAVPLALHSNQDSVCFRQINVFVFPYKQ